jgi:hypothetical protein
MFACFVDCEKERMKFKPCDLVLMDGPDRFHKMDLAGSIKWTWPVPSLGIKSGSDGLPRNLRKVTHPFTMPSSISYLYVPYEGDTALLTVPGHEDQYNQFKKIKQFLGFATHDKLKGVVLWQTSVATDELPGLNDFMVTQIVVYCHEHSRTIYAHMPNPMLETAFGPIVIAKRLYCLESGRTWPVDITVEEAQFAVQNQTVFA